MKTNTMFLSKIPQIFSYDELLTIIKQEVEVLPSIQFIMNQKDNDNNIAILKFKKKEEALRVEKKIKSTKIFNRKLNVQDYKPSKKSFTKNNSQNVKNTKTHLQRDANTKDKNFLDHERSKKKKKFVSGVKITNKIFDHAKITETADLVKEKSSKAPIKPKHQLFCNNKKKNKKANGSQQQRNKKKQKKNNKKNNKNNSKRKLSQTQIIIFNYPHNYTTDNLISFFQNFNPKNAVIIKKKKTKKYFAFVTFPSCVIRDKALHLNGLLINERPITIKKAYKKLLSNSKKQITKNSKTPKLNSNNNSNHNNNQYENRINSLEKEILDLKEIITNLSKNNHKVIKNKNNNLYNNISSKKIQNKSDKGYIHSENEIKDKSNEIQIIKDSENESELSLLENLNPNINDSKTTQSSKRKEEELVYNQFLIRDKEFKEKFEKELKKKNNKKNQEIDKIDGINNSISINQKINQNNNQPTSNNSNNSNKKVDKKPNIQKDLLYYFNQTPKNKEIYMKNIQLNLKNKNKGKGKKSISDKLITSVKCKGITLNNKDCKNHTFDTSGYCIKHRNQKKK